MRKMIRRIGICFFVGAFVWCVGVLADRNTLNEELIRLHVVANSDSEADQALKLRVRDAIMASLNKAMSDVTDVEAAKAYIRENIPKIQQVANTVLKEAGLQETAVVTFCREAFDTRYYDTFTLPAGVYESLRVTIGEGQGRNWWCVVFPTLCIPVAAEEFSAVAAGAGFSDALNGALTGEYGYELRFFFLDVLGKVENILCLE